MAELIATLKPYLAEELVSAGILSQMIKATRFIPPVCGTILECRLADGAPDVDISVRAQKTDSGRDVFAGRDPDWLLSEELLAEPVWQQIRAFCKLWATAHTPINRFVETTWVEFDHHMLEREVPLPCFFFNAPGADPADPEWIFDVALETLLRQPLSIEVKDNLRRCIRCLGGDGKLHYLGVLLSRPSDAIRFCATMAPEKVLDYLASIGWDHPKDKIVRVLKEIVGGFAETIVLNLDVGASILSTASIEVKPTPHHRWPEFLNRLTEYGLCSPSKARGLLRWVGHSEELSNREIWPDISLYPPYRPETFSSTLMHRLINHAKLVCHPDRGLEAKVYIYAGFLWPRATGSDRQDVTQTVAGT